MRMRIVVNVEPYIINMKFQKPHLHLLQPTVVT